VHDHSLEDFILEVEEKVNEMVGQSTLNEYKAYKNIVKHKKGVNRVFSELGVENALRSHPLGVDKILAVAIAVFSVAPPKARRRRASKKDNAKGSTMKVLLPPFAQQRLSPWSPARGNEKLLKMFLMLRSKRLPVLRN
jgi:hypothetical protein